MSRFDLILWSCVLAPLVSALLIGLGLRHLQQGVAAISAALSVLPLLLILLAMGMKGSGDRVGDLLWLHSGAVLLTVGYAATGLTVLMATTVSLLHALIQLYSIGYMRGEESQPRYFATLHLFCFSMLLLVLSPDLMQTYVAWELVGLSSFLLIGFWHHKPSARRAARKAFLLNRVGDVGFLIGLALLLIDQGRLAIAPVNAMHLESGRHTVIALCIFLGIAGKSAQFPLHTWLADAMEGPTPVSALLHSATMVAAGAFLLARLHPFFMASPKAMEVIVLLSGTTLVLSSCMALVQRDLKRILAYSTLSQLAYMILAFGAGLRFAGTFHLFTHAAFKALLFLVAGVLIHQFSTQDIFAMRGARRSRVAWWGLLIGCASLAGIPFITSGYWSKEAILGGLWSGGHRTAFWLAATGVVLTAYYSFRGVFVLARPAQQEPRLHKVEASMTFPIVLLSGLALLVGLPGVLGARGAHHGGLLGSFLGMGPQHFAWLSIPQGVALSALAIGVAWAWLDHGRAGARGDVLGGSGLEALFLRRFYLDEAWIWLATMGADTLAKLANAVDRLVIDGGVDGFAQDVLRTAEKSSGLHNGKVQRKLVCVLVGLVLLGLVMGSQIR